MNITLTSEIEKRAEKAENLSFCKGIKLIKIKDLVANMLSTIGSNNIFEQYTLHDISHIDQMLKIAEWLIPESTKEIMTSAEWLMLTLAIYFHDLGMVVSKEEFNKRKENNEFLKFKSATLTSASKEYKKFYEDEKYLYQEFVRQYHAVRIRSWLELKTPNRYGLSTVQQEIINSSFLAASDFDLFKKDLAMICESHHLDDIDNFSKYKIQSRYGNTDDACVNLNYIAIILRIADLLHITNDRTPTIPRMLIDINNPISIIEWEKQNAVKAITPKPKRNKEGCIDNSIPKDTIEITAYFSGSETAEAYFALSSYLQYVKSELSICNKIAEKARNQEGSVYIFPWKEIDEKNIITEGFEAKKLSFSIEQENILKLLVGHTLYNDSSVVVRELTQNAIDSIKLQKIIDSRNHKSDNSGKVSIRWDEENRLLSFYDNGTGMTIADIENYLLRVGASKYRQKEFIENYTEFNPISRFGIGILTCFMVANDVDIETNHENSEELNQICLRNVNGKYLLKKVAKENADPYIRAHGTIIRLHIRSDIDMTDLEKNLKKWIVVTEVPVELVIGENSKSIGFSSLKEALIHTLKDANVIVDGKKYRVETKTSGNVTIACALRYNKYISDWSFMNIDEVKSKQNKPIVGTCVEGIRVEFTSPGYLSNNLLALANITGSRYQTNVARTALEYDSNQEVLKSIYDCYRMFIEDQINLLKKSNYSLSWAVKEGMFLLYPILPSSSVSDEKVKPISTTNLIQSLSELLCIFVEQKSGRELTSVKKIQSIQKLDIFDCKLISAIEHLFREIPTQKTVFEMIESVCECDYFTTNNPVITNFDESNVIHAQIIKNKQVSKIQVDTVIRKIQLTFEERNDIWDKYFLLTRINNDSRVLHLPKQDFKIQGLQNEVGVKTIGGIYLNSGSELSDYLKKAITALSEKSKENDILIQVFLETIFDSNLLEPAFVGKELDYVFSRHRNLLVNSEINSKIWNIVDVNEFKEVILSKNHNIFSLENWSRRI